LANVGETVANRAGTPNARPELAGFLPRQPNDLAMLATLAAGVGAGKVSSRQIDLAA
jgi:hypothetical protein